MGIARRIAGCISLTALVFVASIYFTFIHHPPPSEILKNQGEQPAGQPEQFILDPNKQHSMAEIARAAWGMFLYKNNYVSVGDVFDAACDADDRVLVGKIIVLEDEESSGIKIRIYTNSSFVTPILYGKTDVLVNYNGKELYKNTLDLCTMEEDDPDRIFSCPVSKGMHFFVKEKKISPFLPKGEYKVNLSIANQLKKTVLCSLITLKI